MSVLDAASGVKCLHAIMLISLIATIEYMLSGWNGPVLYSATVEEQLLAYSS